MQLVKSLSSKKFSVLYLNVMTGSRIDEETPLLPSAGERTVRKESDEVITPLPKLQIAILLLVRLVEPICSQCIYPFIFQVMRCSGYPGKCA